MSEQSKKEDWKKREIGCLWRRKSMLTGFISFDNIDLSKIDPLDNKLNIIAFVNTMKGPDDKRPNIVFYLSNEDSKGSPAASTNRSQNSEEPVAMLDNSEEDFSSDDEVPFL
jgi:hypothetical protein